MQKLNRREIRVVVVAALLILAAIACRLGSKMSDAPFLLFCGRYVRTVIYIGLFTAWGVSLRRRVIQQQTRRNLIAVATLIVFWIVVRTVKYFFVNDPDWLRQLWYLFYLPMLFIPLLTVFVAFALGKPENFRLPKWMTLLYLPTTAFLMLVLTNDLHQLVFTFPPDVTVWSDHDYGYGAGYYWVIGWMLFCALAALTGMTMKCRLPHSRTILFLPFIPIACTMVYGVLYTIRLPLLYLLMGDMTVVYCLLFAATLECCIQCGLIQTNTRYDELFRASTIGAQIAGSDLAVRYASENARAVPAEVLHRAQETAVMLDSGTRLCAASISGGHVYWQEDVSSLLATLEELAGIQEELRGYGSLLDEENKQKKRRKKLEEQQLLYAAVQEKTAPHLRLLISLARKLQAAPDAETARKMLSRLAVVGAYLKRRSNLVILAHHDGAIPAAELELCLKESAANLRVYGPSCAVQFDLTGEMSVDAGTLFDFYEAVVELALDTLTSLTVFVRPHGDGCRMTLMLQGEADMEQLTALFPNSSALLENGVWYCGLALPRGGAAR